MKNTTMFRLFNIACLPSAVPFWFVMHGVRKLSKLCSDYSKADDLKDLHVLINFMTEVADISMKHSLRFCANKDYEWNTKDAYSPELLAPVFRAVVRSMVRKGMIDEDDAEEVIESMTKATVEVGPMAFELSQVPFGAKVSQTHEMN